MDQGTRKDEWMLYSSVCPVTAEEYLSRQKRYDT